MGAPEGNQFWKLRSKHGRDKLFETPELLWEAACEYFEWCNKNPWLKEKSVVSEKGIIAETTPTERPFTRSGFFVFIDCSENWLQEFKKTATNDFLGVIDKIEKIIDTQQIEGAMVGAFNSNLVARIQGLKEQSDVTTQGEKIQTPIIQVLNATDCKSE